MALDKEQALYSAMRDFEGVLEDAPYEALISTAAKCLRMAARCIPSDSLDDEKAEALAEAEDAVGAAMGLYLCEATKTPDLDHIYDAFWQALNKPGTARLLNTLPAGREGIPDRQLILELADAMPSQVAQLWYHLIVKVTKLQ